MEKRFKFGSNWAKYSEKLTQHQLIVAQKSLEEIFGKDGLIGKSFLDVGCGSGIFSIAAIELGAKKVVSFDFDPISVETTIQNAKMSLINRECEFTAFQGDVLDHDLMLTLKHFDVVYSWGVLHHTGQMWNAIASAASFLKPNGRLLISIYNDQGWKSKLWKVIKRSYVSSPKAVRFLILIACFLRLWAPTIIRDFFRYKSPHSWKSYADRRGMSPWIDLVDWVGGYPFEVAKSDSVIQYLKKYQFKPIQTKLVGQGLGCNEFLFVRQ